MAETWGQTSTVLRAVPRALKSFVQWDVVRDTGEKGCFASAAKVRRGDRKDLSVWLIEAALRGRVRFLNPAKNPVKSSRLIPAEHSRSKPASEKAEGGPAGQGN